MEEAKRKASMASKKVGMLMKDKLKWGEVSEISASLHYLTEAYDHVTGKKLDPSRVTAARTEEMKEFRKHGVYIKVPTHKNNF